MKTSERNQGILEVRQQILGIQHISRKSQTETLETQVHEARAGERQKEMVEESLDWSRKLEPPYKACAGQRGTASMRLERVEERVDLS